MPPWECPTPLYLWPVNKYQCKSMMIFSTSVISYKSADILTHNLFHICIEECYNYIHAPFLSNTSISICYQLSIFTLAGCHVEPPLNFLVTACYQAFGTRLFNMMCHHVREDLRGVDRMICKTCSRPQATFSTSRKQSRMPVQKLTVTKRTRTWMALGRRWRQGQWGRRNSWFHKLEFLNFNDKEESFLGWRSWAGDWRWWRPPWEDFAKESTSTASETSVCNLWQWEIVDEYEEQFLTLIYCCIDQTEMASTPDALEDAMEHKCAYK